MPFLARRLARSTGAAAAVVLAAAGWAQATSRDPAPRSGWVDLLDGKTLDGWRVTPFAGGGEVEVKDGAVRLGFGSPLTGIHRPDADLPTVDYELEVVAARLAGTDFFCALTFPVRDSHATLVLGGWGGSLTGLSCLDGHDASQNETRSYRSYTAGRDYTARVRVTAERIQAWLDGDTIVDVPIAGREVGLRTEVLPSRPLGVASYNTLARVGRVRIRRLAQESDAPGPTVEIDPRIELLAILCRLAGFGEYRQARVEVYARAVDAWFADFADHPAVETLRELRARGIGFDAPMSLAVHLTDPPDLELATPLDPWPEALDRRWDAASIELLLGEAREFALEADLAGFLESQAALHATVTGRLRDLLAEKAHLEWFPAFYGTGGGARYVLVPGLLNGGANYGVRSALPGHPETFTSVLGVWQVDGDGAPRFDDSILPTVVHEFSHSFCNPLVDAHEQELAESGQALYPTVAAAMQRQAYGDWRIMLKESLVRACVVRWVETYQGDEAALRQIQAEVDRSFLWTEDLVDALAVYEAQRERYPDLDAFMPRVVELFRSRAGAVEPGDR